MVTLRVAPRRSLRRRGSTFQSNRGVRSAIRDALNDADVWAVRVAREEGARERACLRVIAL